jgi:predicted hydrocarbon binding protein
LTRRVTPERDLTLPAATLLHLRRAFQKEVGAVEATHALHDAGYAAGEDFFHAFAREVGTEPSDLAERVFWDELDRYFDARGWGRLEQERVHPALGMLRARSWGESDPTSQDDSQTGCAFSAGVFAYILGRVGGGPIAVLEVGCRSRGDAECSFLVGSEGAINTVYDHLLDGDPLETALARL